MRQKRPRISQRFIALSGHLNHLLRPRQLRNPPLPSDIILILPCDP